MEKITLESTPQDRNPVESTPRERNQVDTPREKN